MKRFTLSVLIAGLVSGVFCSAASADEYADRGYTNKSIHDSSGISTYKHPQNKSYTSPFDYGPVTKEEPAPAPAPTGKCNCFTFDATKSYAVDAQKLTVAWDFGDGQTSDQPVVKHCYDKAGDYNITLTVKDSSGATCDTGVTSTKVNANFPPTAVAGGDVKACVGETVTFDGSKSSASGPATYTWDFGDGEKGEGAKVSHAYQKPGQYRVYLTVDDGKKTECSVAADSLTARIASSVTVQVKGAESTCVGRSVGFNAESAGGASKYHWDFGDGQSWDGGSSASHVYQKGGDYAVSVTADNGEGFPCSVATSSTKVKVSAPPTANAGENLVCCSGQAAVFDASKSSSPTGAALSYHWDFGDGAASDEMKTTHAYQKNGTYNVVLTVKDGSGSECSVASDSFVAKVHTKPEAVIQVR